MESAGVSTGFGAIKLTEDDIRHAGDQLWSSSSANETIESTKTVCFAAPDVSSNNGPYIVKIQGNNDEFIQTKNADLEMTFKIVKTTDGQEANLVAADDVALVNNIIGSYIKNVHVSFNGVAESSLNQEEYAYKAYLEHVLSLGEAASKTHMSTGGFHIDTPAKYDTRTADNAGYTTRKAMIATSKLVQVYAPLSIDALQTDRFYPPGISITLTFYPQVKEFYMMGEATSTVYLKLNSLKVYVPFISKTKASTTKIMAAWQKRPVELPITKTWLYNSTFTTGTRNLKCYNILSGTMPNLVIVGMVNADAFNGSYTHNPFNFKHANVSQIRLRLNNEILPHEPLIYDFTRGIFQRGYRSTCSALGLREHNDGGTVMSPDQFKGGMFLTAFDLSSDNSSSFYKQKLKQGVLAVEIDLSVDLTAATTVLVLASMQKVIKIDYNKRISVEDDD